jgi:pimeloyl-ACP methyl ester carboxylesterase
MGSEPVILVHGLASSFDHGWRDTGWVDLLQDAGRDVIRFDLPGHGQSTYPPDTDPSDALRAALPDDVAVDAVGFSAGAQTLLRLGSVEPSRFNRLVLIGVGENVFRQDDFSYLADAYEAHARAAESGERSDAADPRWKVFVNLAVSAGNDPKAMAAFLRTPKSRITDETLAGVKVPAHVIIGDKDFAGPADTLVAKLPDASLTVLPGIDHVQAPRDFGCIDAALRFLGVDG